MHTVNIHGQLALEVKLTCGIQEEKSEMTLKGQGRVRPQLDGFTCGFIAIIRNNAAVALFILIRGVFFS